MGIFNDIDGVMNNLYGSNWQSTGADSAKDRYDQIRKNYEVFYEKVVAMKNHIYSVTAANEEAMKSGKLVYLAGKYSSSIGPIFAAVMNAVNGTAVRDADGNALSLRQDYLVATDA